MPLVQTRGAASAQGFGEFAQATAANYIEEVFSCFLYTGTGATQTITNGIDLATKGGLVWIKDRDNAFPHNLKDTVRGAGYHIRTSTDEAQTANPYDLTAFTSSGFTLGVNGYGGNYSGAKIASWTFREQPKFFDVVTYTGTGSNTTIAHSLGSVPGSIIVKRTDTTADWQCYHRSLANTEYLVLNSTAAKATGATRWNSTTPTSSVFSVGTDASVNASGGTYVAYVFAHDAGGFGLTGTDNVISCGSFTTDGSGNATVSLGYEPQWVLIKPTNEVNSWVIVDTMRGYSLGAGDAGEDARLRPNTSDAESTSSNVGYPTATGFYVAGSGSMQHIYIAIRRGPMKVPTVGTSVYNSGTRGTAEATAAGVKYYSGFPVDFVFTCNRAFAGHDTTVYDRLRGVPNLFTNLTTEEGTGGTFLLASNLGFDTGTISANLDQSAWMFRRAPGFFDEVCYTGDGTFDGSYNVNHNLGAVPEFIIAKRRNSTNNWNCYHSGLTSASYQIRLNLTTGQQNVAVSWGPTSTTFKPQYAGNADNSSNVNTGTYVAYLFATCAGVSKVGSYTGTGTTLQIDCGFTGGARFVLIKRTDDSGDWYVWDSARGIVAGNDPYLLLNSTAAEVTGTDYVDTYSAGFEISSTAPAAINASAGSFIFLAIS